MAELTLRYFTTHGPATVKDFKWWSSLTTADIKAGLEMVGAQLNHEVIDGVPYWFAEPAPASQPASPTVHLLQAYDEYIVGYSESKYVLDVSGTANKDSAFIEAALYAPFDDAQTAALHAAAARHGEFLGLPVAVST